MPLRASDAGTEVRTAEAPGPAYTDLSDGQAQRKPIVPEHWRTKAAAREHVRLAAARHGTRPPTTASVSPGTCS